MNRQHNLIVAKLIRQKQRIEYYFPFITCRVVRKKKCLVCTGEFHPHEECDRYEVKLIYESGSCPKVFILAPDIEYSIKAHTYSDKSLCLYDSRDMPWIDNILIAETIIPWIGEWIVFYELYKITGKWEGPEAPHKPEQLDCENKEVIDKT